MDRGVESGGPERITAFDRESWRSGSGDAPSLVVGALKYNPNRGRSFKRKIVRGAKMITAREGRMIIDAISSKGARW
jgi:hypothetical protein